MSRQNQLFTEAFVEEIIIEIDRKELLERVDLDNNIDTETILKAPHNSAIIRILSFGLQKKQEVAYPLFG